MINLETSKEKTSTDENTEELKESNNDKGSEDERSKGTKEGFKVDKKDSKTEDLNGSKNERLNLEARLKTSLEGVSKAPDKQSKILLKPERQRILSLNNVSVTTKVINFL